jgi:hypothetical protein
VARTIFRQLIRHFLRDHWDISLLLEQDVYDLVIIVFSVSRN